MLRFIVLAVVMLSSAPVVVNAQQTERQGVEPPALRKLRPEATQQFRQKRDAMQAQLQQRREESRQRMENLRQGAETRIQEKRDQLRQRLGNIRDERKRQAVERVDERMDALNERMSKHFSEVLERLDAILDRIVSRSEKASANGRDVSSVSSATEAARQAIAAARASVEAQAAKTYVISVTTESVLRQNVGIARQALHADLVKARDAVFAARDAVHRAATTLAQIPGIDGLEVPATATTTP